MQTINLQIIPYTNEALEWHLTYNAGLNDTAIEHIVEICNKVNTGEMLLNDYVKATGCTVAEILDDLKIDYSE